ncbi:hypothetical protein TAMC210_08050 [Thermanaeromonas sp. C210]|nr:hypothetical protein TAMC210_08050 [Thermanaeromonas sp. C210]
MGKARSKKKMVIMTKGIIQSFAYFLKASPLS